MIIKLADGSFGILDHPYGVSPDDDTPATLVEFATEAEALEFMAEAARCAWNEPDPRVVKLTDGRQVLREFYDPAIHGPVAE